jgi:hypothetical protein
MNKEQLYSALRTAVQIGGTYAVAKGWLTPQQVADVAGPIVEFLGAAAIAGTVVWSLKSRSTKSMIVATSELEGVHKVVVDPALEAGSKTLTEAPKVTSAVRSLLPFLAILPLGAMLLGGCVQAGARTTATPNGAVVVDASVTSALPRSLPAKADASVARNAAKLQSYCGYVRLALGASALFVKAENQHVLDQATAGVNAYCMGPPPTDVRTAILELADIYANVMAAGRG